LIRAERLPFRATTAVKLLDGLSERARENYFLARATVGRDYCIPIVIALASEPRH
jgi:hypothetical protein